MQTSRKFISERKNDSDHIHDVVLNQKLKAMLIIYCKPFLYCFFFATCYIKNRAILRLHKLDTIAITHYYSSSSAAVNTLTLDKHIIII